MHLNPNLKLRKIGRRHMIVDTCADNIDLTNVFTLNDSAAWIWNELGTSDFTAETVTQLLTSHYEVTAEQAAEDVARLLTEWRKYRLIED